MVSVMHSPTVMRQAHVDIQQHPLDRLYPLRVDVELRLNTFSKWPTDAAVSPRRLCDNGFYYMGIQDKVQCAFCGGILGGWKNNDDIVQEHARHFSQCELVRLKQKNCARRFEFSNPQEQKSKIQPSNVKPHNSQYSLYSDRLSSFQSWPKSLKQKPEDLSASGLYYKGNGDKCQCYMCGGILAGWEENDIPKNEHKKWFPKCPLFKC